MISRQTFKSTLKWMGAILLVAALGAGGYGYWLWQHCDEYLLKMLVEKQQEFVPDWDVHIGRAHFDWHRRIHVYDVKLKAKGQAKTIATLPEIVIAIDRELFQAEQKIEIESVRVINPVVDLHREVSGAWNWHKLLTLKPTHRSLPEWTFEDATLNLEYDQPGGLPTTKISLRQSNAKLIPSGKRQFRILAQADFNGSGTVAMKGDWNVDAKQWSVSGQLSGVKRSGELLELAAGTSPVFREKMLALDADLERTRVALSPTEETRVAVRPDDSFPIVDSPPLPPAKSLQKLPDFGFDCTMDVKFHVAQAKPKKEWQFRMVMDLKQGTLSHDVLPFPLRGLAGQVYWDNQLIEFRNLTAQNGITRLGFSGHLRRDLNGSDASSGTVQLELGNLILDRRLRGRLPNSMREVYDLVQPSGPADVRVTLQKDSTDGWTPSNFLMTAKGCGSINQKFRYPVTDIQGTIAQNENDLVINLIGQAGGRNVEIRGEVKSPGPDAETWFDVRVDQFPLDDRFRQACTAEAQEAIRQTNLTGWVDANVSLYRPAGPGQEFVTKIGARLSNCEVMLEAFPYRMTDLRGIVTYRSDQKYWSFQKIEGQHGTATISAEGDYRQAIEPGVLAMTITTRGARFDDSLYRALPTSARQVWDDFSPEGKVDTVAKIRWVPNFGFEWSLPSAVVYDARVKLKEFPYPLSDVRAELSYSGDFCEIQSFTAKHEDTKFRGRVNARVPTEGRWQIDLLDLYVDDLNPDRLFRQALPSGVRSVVEELDPENLVSFSGGIRLSGTERETDPVIASWNLHFVLTGNRLNTGVQLENVHGQVTTRGTYDGESVQSDGQIAVESLEVLDYQLTDVNGPYRVQGDFIQVGSAKVFDPTQNRAAIPVEERLTAKAIDGLLTFDAEIDVRDEVRYRSQLRMVNGRLEEYARRYLPGTHDLSGVMNGWVNLSGTGSDLAKITGNGQLRVSPAELYELPIIAQVFQVLSLTSTDRTAFRFGDVDFEIAKSQFLFKSIDLVGDSLSLRGLGRVGFDGRLNIDFYSRLSRARLPTFVGNIVNPVLEQATKDWVKVEVRGKTNRPNVKMKPVPIVDETIKGFLGVLNNGMSGDFRGPSGSKPGR